MTASAELVVKPVVEVRANFHLWTVQLPRWPKLRHDGIVLIDITVKSGIKAFAPEWLDLKQYKAGQMSEEEYVQRYLEKMDDTQIHYKDLWDHLSAFPYAVYGCYCKAGEFCHRHLFKSLAQAHLERMGWKVKQEGEITEDTVIDLEIPEAFVQCELRMREKHALRFDGT